MILVRSISGLLLYFQVNASLPVYETVKFLGSKLGKWHTCKMATKIFDSYALHNLLLSCISSHWNLIILLQVSKTPKNFPLLCLSYRKR